MDKQYVDNFISYLDSFVPADIEQAAAAVIFLSRIDKLAATLKGKAYDKLNSAVGPDGAAVTSIVAGDLRIVKVQTDKKIYNKSEDITAAEVALKDAKNKLDDAKDAAGFTVEKSDPYWQIKK